MASIILTLENFKDSNTKFRNQIKIRYSDKTQVASLKVNLKDHVKKASIERCSAILAQFLTKIVGLEKFGL